MQTLAIIVTLTVFTKTVFSSCVYNSHRNNIIGDSAKFDCTGKLETTWIFDHVETSKDVMIHVQKGGEEAFNPSKGLNYLFSYDDSPNHKYLTGAPDDSSAAVNLWLNPPNSEDHCIKMNDKQYLFSPHTNTYKNCMVFLQKYQGKSVFKHPIIGSNDYDIPYQTIFANPPINATIVRKSSNFKIGKGHNMNSQLLQNHAVMTGTIDYTISGVDKSGYKSPTCIIKSMYTSQFNSDHPQLYFSCSFNTQCNSVKTIRIDMVGIKMTDPEKTGYVDPFALGSEQTTGIYVEHHYQTDGTYSRKKGSDGYKLYYWKNDDPTGRICILDGFFSTSQLMTYNHLDALGYSVSIGIRFWRENFQNSIENPPSEQVKYQHFWHPRTSSGFSFVDSMDLILKVNEQTPEYPFTTEYLNKFVAIWDTDDKMRKSDFKFFKNEKTHAVVNYIQTGPLCSSSFSVKKTKENMRWRIRYMDDVSLTYKTFDVPMGNKTMNWEQYTVGTNIIADQITIKKVYGKDTSKDNYFVSSNNCKKIKSIHLVSGVDSGLVTHGSVVFPDPKFIKTSLGRFPIRPEAVTRIVDQDQGPLTVWGLGLYEYKDSKQYTLSWFGANPSGATIDITEPTIGYLVNPNKVYSDISWDKGSDYTGWAWSSGYFSNPSLGMEQVKIRPFYIYANGPVTATNIVYVSNRGGTHVYPKTTYGENSNVPSLSYDFLVSIQDITKIELQCIDTTTNKMFFRDLEGAFSETAISFEERERIGFFYHNTKGIMMTLGDKTKTYRTKEWARYMCTSLVHHVDRSTQVYLFDFSTIRQEVTDSSGATMYEYRIKLNSEIDQSDLILNGIRIDSSISLPEIPFAPVSRDVKAVCDSDTMWTEKNTERPITCFIKDMEYRSDIMYTSTCKYVSVDKLDSKGTNGFKISWTSDEVDKKCPGKFIDISFATKLKFGDVVFPMEYIWSPIVKNTGVLRDFQTNWKTTEINKITTYETFETTDNIGLDIRTRRPGETWYFNIKELSTTTNEVTKVVSVFEGTSETKYVWFGQDQKQAILRNKDKRTSELESVGITLSSRDDKKSIVIGYSDKMTRIKVQFCELVTDSIDATKKIISCNGFETDLRHDHTGRPVVFDYKQGRSSTKKISPMACVREFISGGDWVLQQKCFLQRGSIKGIWINGEQVNGVVVKKDVETFTGYFSNAGNVLLGRNITSEDRLWVVAETKTTKSIREIKFYIVPDCNAASKTPWKSTHELGRGKKKDTEAVPICQKISPPKDFPVTEYFTLYQKRDQKKFTATSLDGFKELNWKKYITFFPVVISICIAQFLVIICGIMAFFAY